MLLVEVALCGLLAEAEEASVLLDTAVAKGRGTTGTETWMVATEEDVMITVLVVEKEVVSTEVSKPSQSVTVSVSSAMVICTGEVEVSSTPAALLLRRLA